MWASGCRPLLKGITVWGAARRWLYNRHILGASGGTLNGDPCSLLGVTGVLPGYVRGIQGLYKGYIRYWD